MEHMRKCYTRKLEQSKHAASKRLFGLGRLPETRTGHYVLSGEFLGFVDATLHSGGRQANLEALNMAEHVAERCCGFCVTALGHQC